MTRYHIGFGLQFVAADGNEADFDKLTDKFYDELLKLEDVCPEIHDPDMVVHAADLTVDVEVLVDAESLIDAQVCAISAARSAAHAIEVGTPGWEASIANITVPSPTELQDA